MGQEFIDNGRHNIVILAKLRHIEPEQLVLDLAIEFGWINQPEYQKLAKQFVVNPLTPPNDQISYDQGALRLNGRLIREVKQHRRSTKLEYILRSFEEISWRSNSLDFSSSFDLKQIADAVAQLNRKLTGMTFFATGTKVRWEFVGRRPAT